MATTPQSIEELLDQINQLALAADEESHRRNSSGPPAYPEVCWLGREEGWNLRIYVFCERIEANSKTLSEAARNLREKLIERIRAKQDALQTSLANLAHVLSSESKP